MSNNTTNRDNRWNKMRERPTFACYLNRGRRFYLINCSAPVGRVPSKK